MNIQKGRPRGRPPGSLNKRSAVVNETVAPNTFAGDAHALLMLIYKDPTQPIKLRLDAAKAAIRFEKPCLAAVEMSATIKRDVDDLSDAELAAIAAGVGEARRH